MNAEQKTDQQTGYEIVKKKTEQAKEAYLCTGNLKELPKRLRKAV